MLFSFSGNLVSSWENHTDEFPADIKGRASTSSLPRFSFPLSSFCSFPVNEDLKKKRKNGYVTHVLYQPLIFDLSEIPKIQSMELYWKACLQ